MHARGSIALTFALALIACNGSDSGPPDAGDDVDAAPFMLCGNGLIEGSETCDDGATAPDDGCSETCTIECGDGIVGANEACDTAIAGGETGACPTDESCTDDDPCTTGIVSGGECQAVCDFATTTTPIDDDGCCPTGQDATTDNDCEASCGNGVVESPEELCDTAITGGGFGECPTACDDGDFCTTDTLVNGGTCSADCTETDITEIGPDDDCCPPGATPISDVDCPVSCGDGFVTAGETCDTAIAAGNPGACPTACNDGNVCTTDNLVNGGTCLADCTETAIGPGPMDGCCPIGSDLGDDPDCPPSCGDGVITSPETCDDDNSTGGDGCSATCQLEPIGFRFSDLDLKDPHVFAQIIFCFDVTNTVAGMDGVNPILQTNIQTDEDGDGLLDLSIANTFNPLVQTAGSTTAGDLVFPDCTAPMSTTSCTLPAGAPHTAATVTNQGSAAVCLGTLSGTTGGYSPAIVSPTAPAGGTCYSANAGTVTFDLGGIPITLQDAQIGGEWFGSPATEIRDGLIRGFMTEAQAMATIIPEGTTGQDAIDGEPLSELLRGGVGNCSVNGMVGQDVGDKDMGPGGAIGWYFYLNFSAARVSYTEL
jgi:cysteine-rich repeat protein